MFVPTSSVAKTRKTQPISIGEEMLFQELKNSTLEISELRIGESSLGGLVGRISST
jgi:hypothetical protein